MSKVLTEMLCELEKQIKTIEPHFDAYVDCLAHENALYLISMLIKYSKNDAYIHNIKRLYYKKLIEGKFE